MIIRRAQITDMDGLNKLLMQVLMVHHHGRPDIFKPSAACTLASSYTNMFLSMQRKVVVTT